MFRLCPTLRFLLVVATTFSTISSANAQSNNLTNATSTPIPGAGHNYIKLLSETVDPANGNLSVRISTPTPPGRQLSLPFTFGYDSNGVWVPMSSVNAATWGGFGGYGYLTANGWSYLIPRAGPLHAALRTVHYCVTANDCRNVDCVYFNNWTLGDAHGGRHNLGLLTQTVSTLSDSHCAEVSLDQVLSFRGPTFTASVASSASTLSPLSFADVDGTTYTFAGTTNGLATLMEDRNGNQITIQDSGSGVISEKDTLGRTVLSTSGFGASGNTVTISGLSSPYQITWGTASFNFNTGWTLINPGNPNGCTAAGQTQGTQPVITAITLPNGKQYQFFYDSVYGLLNKVVYPSGATVTYAWGENTNSARGLFPDGAQNAGACDWEYGKPAILHRYVSFDGVNTALQQDFQYSTTWSTNGSFPTAFTSKQTIITTKDLVRGTSAVTTYLYASGISGEPDPTPLVATPLPPDHQIPVEQTITYQDGSGHTLRTVNKTWANAQQLLTEQDTLDNGQTSKIAYSYGPGSQVTEKDEYDFGQTTPSRKTVINYQTFAAASPAFPGAANILDKPCQSLIYDGSGNRVAETDYLYDGGTTVCGTAGTPSVSAVTSPTGHDETNYSSTSTRGRGNVTSVTRQCFPSCTNAVRTFSYDETGQVLSSKDPNGNVTSYSYADNYASGTGTVPGNTNAFLTQVTLPATGSAHIEKFSYGYSDGQLRSSIDQNNQTTSYQYSDPFLRPTQLNYPDGGQTTLSYNDTAPSPTATTSRKMNTSGQLITNVAVMDGIGHLKQTQLTSDPQGTDFTDTAYDGLGLVRTVSNPHRSAASTTDGTTTYAYDALGRTTSLTLQDGSITHTAYCGASTLVTDPAGKWRRSRVDGLGRLVEVDEPNSPTASVASTGCPGTSDPILITTYSYDVLDNLTGVVQNGSRNRSFFYDSLSRLTSAANPESGTVTYKYDSDSNCASPNSFTGDLVSKTDARSIRTCMQYDALHRVKQKNYSDGITPSALFFYDVSPGWGGPYTNAIGRLTDAWTGTSNSILAASTFSYDSVGRVALTDQVPPMALATGTIYPENFTYDLASNMTSYKNDVGIMFSQTFDAAGRAAQLSSSLVDAQHPATLATVDSSVGYYPNGAIGKITYGNGVTQAALIEARLQPCVINWNTSNSGTSGMNGCTGTAPTGTIQEYGYAYGGWGSTNNGNITAMDGSGTQSFLRSFTYDSLNRLATMTDSFAPSSCKGLQWTYDPWGNRTDQTVTAGTCNTFHQAVDPNNRLSGSPYAYDAAGNMTHDASHSYTYDAENRLIQVDGGSTATYAYNALGQRVEKITGSTKTDYLYDPSGNALNEFNNACASVCVAVDYFYLGGQLIGEYVAGTTVFLHKDHLGSTRLVTDLNKNVVQNLDYLPFGELNSSDSGISTHKFTGKERDSESGLDNFGARYNSSSMGRFMSPDPYNAGAFLDGPQTWNAYSYVVNNPLNAIDPNGLDCVYTAGAEGNPNAGSLTIVHGDCVNKGGKDDGGVFVDNDENHPVQKSDVTLSDDGSLGLVSYRHTDGFSTGYACLGNCPSDSVQVNAAPPGTPTMSAAPYPGTLTPPPQITFKPPTTFWERLAVAAGCTVGLDAELMGPEIGPSNGNDKPESKLAEGKYKVPFMRGTPGRPPEMNKSGKSNAEAMNAAAGGAALVGNQQACLQNASGQR